MDNWQLQCSNCSQIFNAEKAVWCKCSYQYPTKICPYCLKCFCISKEAFFNFQKNNNKNEFISHYSIKKHQIPEWLERIGILKLDEIKDITKEEKASKTNFFKAAYNLGYFDKKEIFNLKKLLRLTP